MRIDDRTLRRYHHAFAVARMRSLGGSQRNRQDLVNQALCGTPFLEFIDRAAMAWDDRKDAATDFHLVLDEMNLARGRALLQFVSLPHRDVGKAMCRRQDSQEEGSSAFLRISRLPEPSTWTRLRTDFRIRSSIGAQLIELPNQS